MSIDAILGLTDILIVVVKVIDRVLSIEYGNTKELYASYRLLIAIDLVGSKVQELAH